MWCVPRDWQGEVVYIIASGPSVRQQNLLLLSEKKVIVVNSSWEVYPKADYLFFADVRWWGVNSERVLNGFAGKIVTISRAAKHKRLLKLEKVKPPPGLTDNPAKVAVCHTSLQGALNIAVHTGAAGIVLLGADMCKASDGATHHHPPHKWPQKPDCWDKQMSDLEHSAAKLSEWGIDVINTSLESRIGWWQKRRLEDCV